MFLYPRSSECAGRKSPWQIQARDYIPVTQALVNSALRLFYYLLFLMFYPRPRRHFLPIFLSLVGVSSEGQITFQTPATAIMETLIELHHDIVFFLVIVVVFVGCMLIILVEYYSSYHKGLIRVAFSHNVNIERI